MKYKYLDVPFCRVIMNRPYWKHEEELDVTETITAGDVIDHAMMLFNNATFLCFAHGNIDKQQVMCTYFATITLVRSDRFMDDFFNRSCLHIRRYVTQNSW